MSRSRLLRRSRLSRPRKTRCSRVRVAVAAAASSRGSGCLGLGGSPSGPTLNSQRGRAASSSRAPPGASGAARASVLRRRECRERSRPLPPGRPRSRRPCARARGRRAAAPQRPRRRPPTCFRACLSARPRSRGGPSRKKASVQPTAQQQTSVSRSHSSHELAQIVKTKTNGKKTSQNQELDDQGRSRTAPRRSPSVGSEKARQGEDRDPAGQHQLEPDHRASRSCAVSTTLRRRAQEPRRTLT